MKKLALLFTILLFINCKKEATNVMPTTNVSESEKSIEEKAAVTNRTIDTIFFEYDASKKYSDYATTTLLEKAYSKDSICKAEFRIDFIENGQLYASDTLKINGLDEGSDWYGSYGIDTLQTHFKIISVGYPACGYSHKNYLFFTTKNNIQKVDAWYSTGDGGWFEDVEFFKNSPTLISCRRHSFWPDENSTDEEEEGVHELSDSVLFVFKNNRWQKQSITKKGEVYRTYQQKLQAYLDSNTN